MNGYHGAISSHFVLLFIAAHYGGRKAATYSDTWERKPVKYGDRARLMNNMGVDGLWLYEGLRGTFRIAFFSSASVAALRALMELWMCMRVLVWTFGVGFGRLRSCAWLGASFRER
jgi:hypothetical protein